MNVVHQQGLDERRHEIQQRVATRYANMIPKSEPDIYHIYKYHHNNYKVTKHNFIPYIYRYAHRLNVGGYSSEEELYRKLLMNHHKIMESLYVLTSMENALYRNNLNQQERFIRLGQYVNTHKDGYTVSVKDGNTEDRNIVMTYQNRPMEVVLYINRVEITIRGTTLVIEDEKMEGITGVLESTTTKNDYVDNVLLPFLTKAYTTALDLRKVIN